MVTMADQKTVMHQKNMDNHKYKIDKILDKYSQKKMSLKQASTCLLKKDISKWKQQYDQAEVIKMKKLGKSVSQK